MLNRSKKYNWNNYVPMLKILVWVYELLSKPKMSGSTLECLKQLITIKQCKSCTRKLRFFLFSIYRKMWRIDMILDKTFSWSNPYKYILHNQIIPMVPNLVLSLVTYSTFVGFDYSEIDIRGQWFVHPYHTRPESIGSARSLKACIAIAQGPNTS